MNGVKIVANSVSLRLVRWLQAGSLRIRFIFTTFVLLVLVLQAVLNTNMLVRTTAEQSGERISKQRALHSMLNDLEQYLQSAESAIYHHSLLSDSQAKLSAQQLLAKTSRQIAAMLAHEQAQKQVIIRDNLLELQRVAETLQVQVQIYLDFLASKEKRVPLSLVLIKQLQPVNKKFRAELERLLTHFFNKSNGLLQKQTISIARQLRYVWTEQVMAARELITRQAGEERGVLEFTVDGVSRYAGHIDQLLNRLRTDSGSDTKVLTILGNLHEHQQALVSLVRETLQKKSRDSRADLHMLSDLVRPVFQEIWSVTYRVEFLIENMGEDNARELLMLSDRLAEFLWTFLGFVCLVALAAYVILEFVIRRPIIEISKALEAESEGQTYQPVLPPYPLQSRETRMLSQTFRAMQHEVRSRQTRLESILDNAGEGIVTCDEEGTIETFNNTALDMFSYTSEQVLGKSIQDLILIKERVRYRSILHLCQELSGESKRRTVLVHAVHKDGSNLPLSVSINRFSIQGKILYIMMLQDISEREEMMNNLRFMAENDSLTGIYNRVFFMSQLDRMVENIKRGVRSSFALLYIDLDNFQFINDTMGHLAGDQVLVDIAQILTRRSRKSDFLARIGGDEFGVLAYGVDPKQVQLIADSYQKLLADYILQYEGKNVSVGCSIGVALFGQQPLSRNEILAQADLACHIAKRSGRNRVHIFERNDQHNVTLMSEDMGWGTRIKAAIDQDQFEIACQPIVNCKTMETSHYEVLLRLRDEDSTLIQPSGFLPAAVRLGLMHDVDKWVIIRTMEILGELRRNCAEPLHLSLNLSAKSLEDKKMFSLILSEIRNNSVEPGQLSFEVTESDAIANLGNAIKFLNKIRDMGCKTALDDFGVGYSSFSYLKDLPVDYVKIDGSFVRNIQRDELHLTMVRSMNEVAHAMGKMTVAEYVSNAECLRSLRDIGIDYVQGYWLGEPKIIDSTMDCLACG